MSQKCMNLLLLLLLLYLFAKELCYYHKVLKICIIINYIYLMLSFFQVVFSIIYTFNDYQHFLIMNVIIMLN